MKFTLEKISADDQLRILADASAGAVHGPAAQFEKYGEMYWGEGPSWAIGPWRKSYLIRAPRYTACGSSQRYYYLFSDGSWYQLARRASMSEQVAILGQDQIRPGLLSHLKEQITAAFAVFGERGDGPDSAGWGATIVPVFVGESRRG